MAASVQSRNERSSSLGGKVSLEGREKSEFLEKKRHETRTEIGAASYQKGWDTLGAEMQVKSKGKEPCITQKPTTNQSDKDLSNSYVDESSKVGHAVKPNLKEQEAIYLLKPKTNIRVQEASDSLKPKLIKTNNEEELVLACLIKGKSGMGRAKLKKVAREVGKAQGAGMKPLEITVGTKRHEDTKMLAECEGRPQKRSCDEEGKNNVFYVKIYLRKRRWLLGSTARNNDFLRVELLGAWEPPDSSCVGRISPTMESQYYFPF